MKVSRIFDEFEEYRSYVSHTLWKQRLFLGMDKPDDFVRRLRDAWIWPLVPKEAKSLLKLACTLYGIDCAPFRDQVVPRMQAKLAKLEDSGARLLAGERGEDWKTLRGAAVTIRDELAAIPAFLREQRMRFSEAAVIEYLAGRTAEDLLAEAHAVLRGKVAPTVRSILADHDAARQYAEFWTQAQQVTILSRSAIIAAAAGFGGSIDVITEKVTACNAGIWRLQGLVWNWSPSVDPAKRDVPSILQKSGLSRPDDIVSRIEECCVL